MQSRVHSWNLWSLSLLYSSNYITEKKPKSDNHLSKFDNHLSKFDYHLSKFDNHLSKFDWHNLAPNFLAIMLLHNLELCILETRKIWFSSYSFIQLSWSNFNLWLPDAYFVLCYLIAPAPVTSAVNPQSLIGQFCNPTIFFVCLPLQCKRAQIAL